MGGAKRKIVAVFWQDAWVTTDERPDFRESLTISVGWIVKNTKSEIVISSFYDGVGKIFSAPFTFIPKGWVRKIKKIRL